MFKTKIYFILFILIFTFLGYNAYPDSGHGQKNILSKEQIKKRNDYIYRAGIYFRAKRYLKSLQQIEKVLKIDPENEKALLAKAWILYYLARYKESEQTFKKIYKTNKKDPFILKGIGSIYFKKGLKISNIISNTKSELKQIKDKAKKKILEEKLKNLINQRKEIYSKSLKYFKLCSKISPKSPEFYEQIAFIYIAQGIGFYSQAIPYLDKCLPFIEYEYEEITRDLKLKEIRRDNYELSQKEKKLFSTLVNRLLLRKRYTIAKYTKIQSLAINLTDYLILEEYNKIEQAEKQKKTYAKNLLLGYIKVNRDRIKKLLEINNKLQNKYKKLLTFYKLENYNEVAKYIKKNMKRFSPDKIYKKIY